MMWVVDLSDEQVDELIYQAKQAVSVGMGFKLGFDPTDNSLKWKSGLVPFWSPPIPAEEK